MTGNMLGLRLGVLQGAARVVGYWPVGMDDG